MADKQQTHFELFGLPPVFALDAPALEAAFQIVQSTVHPDRFASAGATERRVAMQWATRANEAFQTLRSPLRRAAYLCELHGAPIDAESNTAMPPAFLMQQLEWREALEHARGASDVERHALQAEVVAARGVLLGRLRDAIDVRADYPEAARLVRQLMFVEKFADEVQQALHAAEASSVTAR